MLAVPHGLQDSHEEIVHDKGDGSGKVDLEIGQRLRQHLRRGSHENQNPRSRHNSHHCEDNAADQAESHGGVDGFLQLLLILLAEIFCRHHTGADGDAVEKAHQQKNQISRGADCRQRVVAEEISYDQRIRRIVELLEQISPEQGYREGDQPFPDRPVGHPCCRRR